jgi:polyhydroxyalkanoate synthesis regulator phasin
MTKAKRSMGDIGSSVRKLRAEGERLVGRIRRDTRALRSEIVRDVRAFRKEVGSRAGRTIRDLERRVLREFHAATAERVAKLEKRIARLEQATADLERKLATMGATRAA